MILEAWITVLAISVFGTQLTESIFKPIFLKFRWDVWYLSYVSFVVIAPICFATGANGFSWFPPELGWVGRILTAVVCGVGPSFIYNMIDRGQPAKLPDALK